ncbi:ArnT family glycosyltransferase [Paenibacillus hamazuiensis]|uniref:ArnT family glycosyltransferase n=1 Tax=Paenibacillus hamazuiensis TaxID=2936508 RepID=UPI00200D50D8|nr:glycosyltransferase family 39 protein [Paenibacillus hamazuiensis]
MIINLRSSKKLLVFFIFLFILLLRIPNISNSPYEYDSWRQSDTESIAYNFAEAKFNIFYPEFNYDGPPPNYVQLEFQITTFLIALLYKWFGYHYALARTVPIVFFIGSAIFLYCIGKQQYSRRTAVLAVLLYGISPVNILYSRAIMPESAALFFFMGAFHFFSLWIKNERFSVLMLAGLFTALAIAEKVPTIFVGIPMIVMALVKYKTKALTEWKLWLFLLISLVPPYVYFQWSYSIAEHKFVSCIASKHVLPDMLTAVFSETAMHFFYKELPAAFTGCAIVLFVAGLITIDWRKHYAVGAWALAMILELMTVVAVIKFNYYLILISPPVALLGAAFLSYLYQKKLGPVWVAGLLAIICLSGFGHIRPMFDSQHTDVIKQGRLVQELTDQNDLIVVGTDDPSLLNAARRKGWRVTNAIPEDSIAELQYFINHGAKYFVPLKGFIYGDDGKLKRYLEMHFKKITLEDGYTVYKLSK